MKLINIGGLPIELEQKRIKNMYLKVLPPEGKIRITAPLRMNEEEIRRFVLLKQEWIREQQIKLQQRNTHQEYDYLTGEEHYVWGQKILLSVVERKGRSKVELDRDHLTLYIKEENTPESRKHILDQWYKEVLSREIPELITKWEQITGVESKGFTIRDMKTRWGTCNIRTKKICLSLQLVKKPPICLEYVVLHELVHLLEGSHNQRFKAYMDHFMPEWRNIRKQLNGVS